MNWAGDACPKSKYLTGFLAISIYVPYAEYVTSFLEEVRGATRSAPSIRSLRVSISERALAS